MAWCFSSIPGQAAPKSAISASAAAGSPSRAAAPHFRVSARSVAAIVAGRPRAAVSARRPPQKSSSAPLVVATTASVAAAMAAAIVHGKRRSTAKAWAASRSIEGKRMSASTPDQPLEPRISPQRRELRVDPEPARGHEVRHREQRLEEVQGPLLVAEQQVRARGDLLVIGTVRPIALDRKERHATLDR